jgi:hypothetical protein
MADTLRENASGSFDEEYDVVDEDEYQIPNPINQVERNGAEVIAGRNRTKKEEAVVEDFAYKVQAMNIEMQSVNMFQLKDVLLKDKDFSYNSNHGCVHG